MESPAKLARDNTMQTTAKEGIEFLEKSRPDLAEQCKTVTNENPTNGAGDAKETAKNGDTPAKIPRDNTMVTTAEEGIAFLQRQGAQDVIEKHGLDKLSPRSKQTPIKTKPQLVRDSTMAITTKEGKEFLEKHGGVHAEAKTRSQDAELNNSVSEDGDKVAAKRAAEDDGEEDAEDAKKQKTEEEEEEDNSEKSGEDEKDDE